METVTKICFKCNELKELNSYYKHKEMSDGHLNKCKDCTKKDSLKRHENLSKNPKWVEAERVRHVNKYHRLNYKDKQLEWDKNKPWTRSSKYTGLNRKYKVETGFELHHWSYTDENIENVFVLERIEHKRAHKFIVLDTESRLFKTINGDYLNNKRDHFDYLISKGVKFISYSTPSILET
jgi:hypothetical protein